LVVFLKTYLIILFGLILSSCMFEADKLKVRIDSRGAAGGAVAVKFVILDPLNVTTSATAVITIQAQSASGQVVTSYQDDVDLVSDGSSLINGLSQQERVDIVNGVGTIALTDLVEETVNLSLADSRGSIGDITSTADIIFSNLVATKFVILNPVDSTVGIPTLVRIQAQSAGSVLVATYQNDVDLVSDGNSVIGGIGQIYTINIVNGEGSVLINDLTFETVNLSLANPQGTIGDATSVEDVVFDLGAAAVVDLYVTGVSSIVANGSSTTTLTASVTDNLGNPIPNETVTLNIPLNGGSVPGTVNTNAGGLAVFTLTSSTVAGTYNYTATANAITSTQKSVTFTAGPATDVDVYVTGVSSIVANGSSSTTLTASVTDTNGNPVNNQTVTLNIPLNGGSVPGTVNTNASGLAVFTLTSSTVAGTYNYTATANAITSTQKSVIFTAGAATDVDVYVTGASSILANGSSTTTLTASVTDTNGNPVNNQTVTLNIPLNGGSVPGTVNTNASGLAVFTLTSSTVAGTYNYTATANAITSTQKSVTFTAGVATDVDVYVTGVSSIIANGSSTTTLTASVTDTNGNPVNNETVTLNIPLNGGSVPGTVNTNASGLAVFTLTSSTVAGIYNYTATANAITSTQKSVTFTAGAATDVDVYVTGASSILANGSSTTTLTASVTDTNGNPVNNQTVTLNIPLNGGSVPGTVNTNAGGLAVFTLTSSTVAGTYNYTATANAITSTQKSVTFTAGVATDVDVYVTGVSSIIANGSSTTTLTASVTDTNGNPVNNETVTLNIPLNGGSVPGTVNTNASGLAVFTLTSSTVAGIYNYTATANAITSTQKSVTFTADVATDVDLYVTGASTIAANGSSTTTLTASVTDTNGNPVSNETVTLNIPLNGGSVPGTVNTNAGGLAVFTLTSSTVAGTYDYTATANAVTSTQKQVTFTVGAAANVDVYVTGVSSIVANGSSTTTLTASVTDTNGNPVNNETVTLNIPLNGGSVPGTVSTNASGLAVFTLTSSLVAGTYNYTATANSITSTQKSVTFTADVATDVDVYVTGASSIVANGSSTTTLTASVTDTNGNPVNNETVTLNIPLNGGSVPGTVNTNASGLAVFTLTSSLVAGTYNYTATANSVTSTQKSVTFIAGAVAYVDLYLTGSNSIVANGSSTTTFTASVTDTNGNPINNEAVVLNIQLNGGSVPGSVNTNAGGLASFTLTSSTVAGSYNFTATADVITSGVQSVTFVADVADNVDLYVTGSSTIAANGSSTTTLTASVTDTNGNPVNNETVTLNIPLNGGSVPGTVNTNASGLAVFTLTSSLVAGTYDYTATANSITSTQKQVSFTVGAAANVDIYITGVSSIVADGVTTTTIELTPVI